MGIQKERETQMAMKPTHSTPAKIMEGGNRVKWLQLMEGKVLKEEY
jgi:hypothetical protein